jgi:hypothetical protein
MHLPPLVFTDQWWKQWWQWWWKPLNTEYKRAVQRRLTQICIFEDHEVIEFGISNSIPHASHSTRKSNFNQAHHACGMKSRGVQ